MHDMAMQVYRVTLKNLGVTYVAADRCESGEVVRFFRRAVLVSEFPEDSVREVIVSSDDGEMAGVDTGAGAKADAECESGVGARA